jgi:hypothetical protein
MKDRFFLDDNLSASERAAFRKVIEHPKETFSDLAVAASLDPSCDFKFSDLRDVDFSNSDIRGFNFSGADLRGTRGTNVTFDCTTILTGAQVDASLFRHLAQRETFASDPRWHREYVRMRGADWTSIALWLGEQIARDVDSRAIDVALRIYAETSDASVKTNILYYSARGFKSSAAYRDFLIHVLSTTDQTSLMRTAFRILVSLHPSDVGVFLYCQKLLEHEDSEIRSLALQGLFASRRHSITCKLVQQFAVKETHANIRRLLVFLVTSRRGRDYVRICQDAKPGVRPNTIDFHQLVTARQIENIALNWLLDEHKGGRPSEFEIRQRNEKVRSMLEELRLDGVPFNIESSVPT